MRAPTKPKPRAVDEVARVVRIARMLDEELRPVINTTYAADPFTGTGPMTLPIRTEVIGPVFDILAVAERIAARTED